MITLTWRSDSQKTDLVTITARDTLPVSEQPGWLWWEIAIRHREIFPATAWTVAAREWSDAVNIAVGRALATAHPELASVLLLLVPDWVNDLA
jgi:hypothetical protein